MKMKDKLVLIEKVATASGTIAQVEMMLRFFLAIDVIGIPTDFDNNKDMAEIYDDLGLDNLSSILEVINRIEYTSILNLSIERYKEINNPLNKMVFTPDDIDKLKELSEKYGKNS